MRSSSIPFFFPSEVLRRFPSKARHLVGVSGGRDSVALLDWLIQLGYKDLVVCHLNHHLRGRASEADARFVRFLADRYALPVRIGSASVRQLAARKRISIEAAAREARYSFFAKVGARAGCSTIFLAHHADDLVETLLINLFRGAGTSGLTAMREVSTRPIGKLELTIVRPFLHIWRRDIDEFVKKRKLKFREDASNKDLAPLRNRLRQRIIPYLEKTVGRNIRQNIWRTAVIMSEEETFFETLLPSELSDATALATEPLRKMSVAVQRRALHKWLRGGKVSDVGFDLIERVRGLLNVANQIAKTNLPGDRHVRRKAGKLFME